MPRSSKKPGPDLDQEIARVAEALEKPNLKQPDRLELLRRQASLGDLRDAIDTRARRDAQPHS